MTTTEGIKSKLISLLRPVYERMGNDRFSRPALNHLDRKLERLLPQENGWFVEAGANDGFQQSNTYYLARFKGWKGLLVEPVPHLAKACQKRRKESQVVMCALGPPELTGGTLKIRNAGLMSTVCGALGDDEMEKKRAAKGQAVQGLPIIEEVNEVPVRTLTEVLENSLTPSQFDLLSLDVEGYEVEVLRGLDLVKFQPRCLCIEVFDTHREEVAHLLSPHYTLKEVLHQSTAHSDYFWVRTEVLK
jgi:FkbM family methyltransferase